MKVCGRTHKGLVRDNNEDSIYSNLEEIGCLDNLFIVADGMGGHNGGEIASSKAVEFFIEYIENHKKISTERTIKKALEYANDEVFKMASSDKKYQGMGTTVSLVTIYKDEMYIAHIGDSRVYKLKDNVLSQITEDHTLVNKMVELGYITKAEARVHPRRNLITRAVGLDSYSDIDLISDEIKKDELILICSDGLNTMVEDDVMESILNEEISLEDKADKLIDTALKNGGNDNVSVVLVEV